MYPYGNSGRDRFLNNLICNFAHSLIHIEHYAKYQSLLCKNKLTNMAFSLITVHLCTVLRVRLTAVGGRGEESASPP